MKTMAGMLALGLVLVWDPNPPEENISHYEVQYRYLTGTNTNWVSAIYTTSVPKLVIPSSTFSNGVVQFYCWAVNNSGRSSPAAIKWTNYVTNLQVEKGDDVFNFPGSQPTNRETYVLQYSPMGGTWTNTFQFQFLSTNYIPHLLRLEQNPDLTNGMWQIIKQTNGMTQ